jgi:DNA-binding MarR family transcriptional regulator
LHERKAREAALHCVCFNLRKAARAVTQLYDDALRPARLRATQFTLLAALRVRGRVAVTELAETAVTDRTTLTRNLRVLRRRGLIRIQSGKKDRRVREVSLTAGGEAALADAYPRWERAQAQVAAGLGKERLRRLASDLSASVSIARAS